MKSSQPLLRVAKAVPGFAANIAMDVWCFFFHCTFTDVCRSEDSGLLAFVAGSCVVQAHSVLRTEEEEHQSCPSSLP